MRLDYNQKQGCWMFVLAIVIFLLCFYIIPGIFGYRVVDTRYKIEKIEEKK
jgi:hypothetical protein